MFKRMLLLVAAVVAVASASRVPAHDMPQPPCWPCSIR